MRGASQLNGLSFSLLNESTKKNSARLRIQFRNIFHNLCYANNINILPRIMDEEKSARVSDPFPLKAPAAQAERTTRSSVDAEKAVKNQLLEMSGWCRRLKRGPVA